MSITRLTLAQSMGVVDTAHIVDKVRSYSLLHEIDEALPALLRSFRRAGARRFLEIGTYQGATSAAVRLAFPDALVVTCDLPNTSKSKWNPQREARVGLAVRKLGVGAPRRASSPRFIQVRSPSYLLPAHAVILKTMPFDLVFVDGDHSEDGCFSDLETARQLVRVGGGGTIVVDDYTAAGVDADRPAWTQDVARAVERWRAGRARAGETWAAERIGGWLLELRLPDDAEREKEGG